MIAGISRGQWKIRAEGHTGEAEARTGADMCCNDVARRMVSFILNC
jgi:hypothetical protein